MIRKLPDGTIIYPMRGKHPACPSGYEQLPGEPYMFQPILYECEYREDREKIQPCGKKYAAKYCTKNQIYVNRGNCQVCRQSSE